MELNDSRNSNFINQTREQYMNDLEKWLDEVRLWHRFSTGFAYINIQRITNNLNTPINTNNQPTTYEFVIPPIWKRLVAEIIDFGILFLIKIIITFFMLEIYNLIGLENYNLSTFIKNLQDPKKAMEMYTEILILELSHRFTACYYEIFFLRSSMCATPGKRYMGLMVLHVEILLPVPGQPPNIAKANTFSQLRLQDAVIRSVIKNFFIGFLVPFCYICCIFRFTRTGYDILSHSLVVEYNPDIQNVQ